LRSTTRYRCWGKPFALKHNWWQKLLACSELARQQPSLLETISQKHSPSAGAPGFRSAGEAESFEERPRAAVEFGAKISITVEHGFSISHRNQVGDAYQRKVDLIAQAENIKKKMVCYQSGSALIVSTSIRENKTLLHEQRNPALQASLWGGPPKTQG